MGNAGETNVFRHLCVGVLAIQKGGAHCLHAIHHRSVAVTLGGGQILGVAKQTIGIDQCLVHAAVLGIQNRLQVGIAQFGHHVHAPVGKLAEKLAGDRSACISGIVAGIERNIAQTGQHFMFAIERHPAAHIAELAGAACIEILPGIVDRLSANETVQTGFVGIEHVLTIFQNGQHIIDFRQKLLLFLGIVAGCIGQRQRRQIVTAHVSVQTETAAAPILMVGMLLFPLVIAALRVGGGRKPRLTHERCQQAVGIIAEKQLDVEILSGLERTVQEGHFFQIEMLGINLRLRNSRSRKQKSRR